MAKKTLIALATAWGPQHGGINSFSYDFLRALGVAFPDSIRVYCVTPRASDADVAIMPSWHEGFGLVGREAIGAGVPLVLSTRSGVHRLLDEILPGAGVGETLNKLNCPPPE